MPFLWKFFKVSSLSLGCKSVCVHWQLENGSDSESTARALGACHCHWQARSGPGSAPESDLRPNRSESATTEAGSVSVRPGPILFAVNRVRSESLSPGPARSDSPESAHSDPSDCDRLAAGGVCLCRTSSWLRPSESVATPGPEIRVPRSRPSHHDCGHRLPTSQSRARHPGRFSKRSDKPQSDAVERSRSTS